MAAEIPTCEPSELIAGDSIAFDRSFSDYPASEGWQLAYALRGPKDLAIPWSTYVTASGSGFQVRVPAATAALLLPGTYQLWGYVTKAADRVTVHRGSVTVLPNPASAVNALSHDEQMLAAIDAALEGRLTAEYEEFQVNGRSVKYASHADLLKAQGMYRQRVIDARNPGAGFDQRQAVFSAPS